MATITTTRPADVGLKREMGLIGATWASETSIIGSGWLFGSYFAAAAIGPAAIWAWIIAGVAIIILALVHAELGGMFPVAGGTARFPHLAFGGIAGTSFGFFSWLQAVTVAPIETYAVEHYGQYWLDAQHVTLYNTTTGNVTHWGFVVTIGLMAIFTVINFLAMRAFNRVNAGIAWWKVAIPILAIIVLFFKFHPSNLSLQGGLSPGNIHGNSSNLGYTSWHAFFYTIPAASIIFAYLGFEQADQLAGEVKKPQRTLPLAIILAVLLGTAIYVLLQVVYLGATPASLIPHGWAGLTTADPLAARPFAGLAAAAGLGWLAKVLLLDAFISPFGTGLVYVTSTSRISYGLARNRYYPSIFAKVDKNGVPWFSLIMAFLFGLIFLLPFPSWHSLVNLVTSASVLMYAGAPLAMGAFRNRLPDAERPYRMPGAVIMAPLAFIIANLIIYWSGFETLWKLGVAIIIGYLMILMHFSDNPTAPRLEWKRSSWVFAYLIGMGIISWTGQYGPENTSRLPFGWDFVVVVFWSLVIYFWAQYSALPKDEIAELMEQQSAHHGAGAEEATAAAA